MRVIAGTARRTNLVAPKGQATRPTADRIKENFFNIAASYIKDARVLDLFSGSGAIGIEALSRGASAAVFCDTSKEAIQAIQTNISRCRFTEKATVLPMSANEAISRLEREGRQFDLIYLDPPYAGEILNETLATLAKSKLHVLESIVIAEHDADTPPTVPEGFTIYDSRKYGNTGLTFYVL